MATLSIDTAVYAFEGLLPDLESPPIAARRALDHAGIRLSIEGWRSLPLDERQRITLTGVPDRVDLDAVVGLVRRANPAAQRVGPVADPDPSTPPEALAKAVEPHRTLEPRRWSRLRAVDRYALAHTYRRAVARSAFSILVDALDSILAVNASLQDAGPAPRHLSSPPPPYDGSRQGSMPPATSTYQPAGYYSSVVAPGETPHDGGSTPRPPPAYARASHSSAPAPRVPIESDTPPRRGPPPLPGAQALSHLTEAGEVHMVDVARKPKTERRAVARGSVLMRPETLARLVNREAPKGEVLATARLAGIMAAKRTHEVIPLCHMVALTHMEVILDVDASASAVHVTATADAYDRTGCEMEAMVAVSTACLTVYDMLKGIDRDMVIADVKLMEKSGGRSGHYRRNEGKP